MGNLIVGDFNFVGDIHNPRISGIEICRRLDYSEPSIQASKIWRRNKSILMPYSALTPLVSTDGKTYDTRSYEEIGTLFFITKCHKPKADQITMEVIKSFVGMRKIAPYIAQNKQIKRKVFQDDYYIETYRLRGWEWNGPPYYSVVGKWTKQHIYGRLPSGTLPVLEGLNPKNKHGKRKHKHHEWLSLAIGIPEVQIMLREVTNLMTNSSTWDEYLIALEYKFPITGDQLILFSNN